MEFKEWVFLIKTIKNRLFLLYIIQKNNLIIIKIKYKELNKKVYKKKIKICQKYNNNLNKIKMIQNRTWIILKNLIKKV